MGLFLTSLYIFVYFKAASASHWSGPSFRLMGRSEPLDIHSSVHGTWPSVIRLHHLERRFDSQVPPTAPTNPSDVFHRVFFRRGGTKRPCHAPVTEPPGPTPRSDSHLGGSHCPSTSAAKASKAALQGSSKSGIFTKMSRLHSIASFGECQPSQRLGGTPVVSGEGFVTDLVATSSLVSTCDPEFRGLSQIPPAAGYFWWLIPPAAGYFAGWLADSAKYPERRVNTTCRTKKTC